ncbi:putative O-glycosylation ligase, exosortase A system-associated [Bowmanella dokdonensis]|uniref:O-glycosylation ligase, exosortase A system-associated n=1 Tax=Bowmanella dokdonensis TaxID=751969 RepID=A0A939ITC6_9ALTE|nr:putative O-glycosylation ligase, exosortase A system-associated [Bowmanella dokdonensis]MBN7827326.1 putative O-glycosylation ligase, exosortase A system-associated [Bowmanella dokdonensis]
MRDLLLVGFLFLAMYYAFKRPYIGVAAWIWIALMAPAEWAFGFSQTFRLNLTIVLVTGLAYIFVTKNKKLNFNAVHFWVMMFGFWTLLSTAMNLNIDSAWVWGYWTQFVKILLLFLFITLVIRKKLHVDTLVWAIVLAISAYAAMEAVKFILSGGSHRIIGRAGIISDRNDLAVAINMCIPLVIYLIQTTEHKQLRLGLWGILVLNIISIVGTYSRGGFIGLTILAIAFWWKSKHKLILAMIAALMLPVLYANAPAEWKERQSTVSTAATEDGSFIGRLWAWKVSTLIALDNPLTGGGFGAVMDPVLWPYYAPYTPGFGPIDTPPIPDRVVPKAAHNIFMQVLGDHGFVGLLFFIMILLSMLWTNRRNKLAAKKEGATWCVKLSDALTLSMVGYAITGCNVSLAYFDLPYALTALACTISGWKIYRSSQQPSAEADKLGRGRVNAWQSQAARR